MEYLALYRQFRPGTFDEMIGQDHIVQTLKNALTMSRIAHAYMFSGPRGTGKTTAAKVFAKALNCAKGMTPEPCCECDSCTRIAKGYSMDVIEIDAASNRGIGEIRDLREKVKFAPTEGRYKVYIIDEVHMLTTEAFNALLKTLEEPPQHVVFILATTDPEDVPATVLSRCQKYDFRTIPIKLIQQQLFMVCGQTNTALDDNAAITIAERSLGGMRDALSILEQCIAFSPSHVTLESVHAILGLSGSEEISSLVDALVTNNTALALRILNECYSAGKDMSQLLKDTLTYLKDMFVTDGKAHSGANVDKTVTLSLIDELSQSRANPLWDMDARLCFEIACMKFFSKSIPITHMQSTSQSETKQPTVQLPVHEDAKVTPQIDTNTLPEMSLDVINAKWDEILEAIKKERISLRAFVIEGKPVSYREGVLTLLYKKEFAFHRENLGLPKNKVVVEAVISRVLNSPVTLSFQGDEIAASPTTPEETSSGIEPAAKSAIGHENTMESSEDLDVLVKEALRIFGGRLTKVENEGDV